MTKQKVGDFPDFSKMPKRDRNKIPACHTLTEYEIGKIPVRDNKFYNGHVGFYEQKDVFLARLYGKIVNLPFRKSVWKQKVLRFISSKIGMG